MSDISDLSEIESDNEVGGQKKTIEPYTIRNALRAPRATTYSTRTLFGEFD